MQRVSLGCRQLLHLRQLCLPRRLDVDVEPLNAAGDEQRPYASTRRTKAARLTMASRQIELRSGFGGDP